MKMKRKLLSFVLAAQMAVTVPAAAFIGANAEAADEYYDYYDISDEYYDVDSDDNYNVTADDSDVDTDDFNVIAEETDDSYLPEYDYPGGVPIAEGSFIYLEYGDKLTVCPSVNLGSFSYEIDDPEIAHIFSDGCLTALHVGQTTIHAVSGETSDEPVDFSFTVKVVPKKVVIRWGESYFYCDGKTEFCSEAEVESGLLPGDTCGVIVEGASKEPGEHKAKAVGLTNPNYKIDEVYSALEWPFFVHIDDFTGYLSIYIQDWTYGFEPSEPIIGWSTEKARDLAKIVYRKADEGEDKFTDDVPTEIGDYVARIFISTTGSRIGTSDECNFTIHPREIGPHSYIRPEGRFREYTAEPLELVVPGECEIGTMEYSLDGENWSEAIPTAVNVGDYTVYFRIIPDDPTYSSELVESNEIFAQIFPAQPESLFELRKEYDYLHVYTGEEQPIFTMPEIIYDEAKLGKIEMKPKFSFDDIHWTSDIPTAADPGEYRVHAIIDFGPNFYKDDGVYISVILKAMNRLDVSEQEFSISHKPDETKTIDISKYVINCDGPVKYELCSSFDQLEEGVEEYTHRAMDGTFLKFHEETKKNSDGTFTVLTNMVATGNGDMIFEIEKTISRETTRTVAKTTWVYPGGRTETQVTDVTEKNSFIDKNGLLTISPDFEGALYVRITTPGDRNYESGCVVVPIYVQLIRPVDSVTVDRDNLLSGNIMNNLQDLVLTREQIDSGKFLNVLLVAEENREEELPADVVKTIDTESIDTAAWLDFDLRVETVNNDGQSETVEKTPCVMTIPVAIPNEYRGFKAIVLRERTLEDGSTVLDRFTQLENNAAPADGTFVISGSTMELCVDTFGRFVILFSADGYTPVKAMQLSMSSMLGMAEGSAVEGYGSFGKLGGDASGDSNVNSDDALLALRYSLGSETLGDDALVLADVNGDGVVDSADAVLILRSSVGYADRDSTAGIWNKSGAYKYTINTK